MSLNFRQTRDLLHKFDFQSLFIQVLGWSRPSRSKAVSLAVAGQVFQHRCIAEISGVAVFEVSSADGTIPDAKVRAEVYTEITSLIAENLLIFIDQERTRSLWYWVKREDKKRFIRNHLYVKGQPGDLFLSKLGSLVIDITQLEADGLSVVEIAYRLQDAFDVEPVTKKFYKEFEEQHQEFLQYVKGIDDENDRRWYTSVILNRLMFVYFLQRKGFIDHGDLEYLPNKLKQIQQRGDNLFYQEFLHALFFESFAKPEHERDPKIEALVGNVKYLNGGLFLKHRIEQQYQISIADEAFARLLDLFKRYSWNLDDTPEGKDDEINPDVLGYIFEKYINQKAFGAYYTRPQITEYLCDRTIHKLIIDRVNAALSDGYQSFTDINDLILKLDTKVCRLLIEDILPNLSILDPACGSGAFLVAAMKTLIHVYSAVIGIIELMDDAHLQKWLHNFKQSRQSLSYYIKKRIVTDNLYGVDIMEEATEIAKLRLFLALVSAADKVDELEPLPNIDFNIMAGNSLIGLIGIDATAFDTVGKSQQGNLLQALAASDYQKVLDEKNQSIALYKKHAFIPGEEMLPEGDVGTEQDTRLLNLRQHIDDLNQESQGKLNVLLLDEFSQRLGIKYEEVQLTGKPKKRLLNVDDIANLKPFHWGYHFDKVLNNGGFDAIITNPPWEIFKPQAKEFFAQHNELVTKNKMDIKAFEKEQKKLLENQDISQAWLEYQSQFPYVSAYYRSSAHYKNQISVVNGKKAGTDINLYKLFIERCFYLLREGGECGIVVPSGIYTDLGTKQLREMLFSETQVTGLFCFENRKMIFEGVHRSFKFVVLTFIKGGTTPDFPSAFMRLDVRELARFPNEDSLNIDVDMVRRLSPDSLSVMEFKSELDIQIAEKMLRFPLLGEKIDDKWNFVLKREFDRGNNNNIFQIKPTPDSIPLFVGKMFHQFLLTDELTPYWIQESIGRTILGGEKYQNQILDYQLYRWVHRRIARNTDSRTLITTIAPKRVFCDNNSTTIDLNKSKISNLEMLFLTAICNTFIVDWLLRQKVTTTLNMFYIYQLPIPRLTAGDKYFNEIVEGAAKLICTTPEFDDLAQEVGLGSHKNGVTDETERAEIRAELDGMIAHLYGLSKEEFAYILTTFPLVPDAVKQAALTAYLGKVSNMGV
ncbi:Eco57I restriction-modification methylase domain-containing protein [Nodularia spumigena]|uniref:Eco57I restriction-modification methylase domain-containing protein n=1 Tax=Nodularia spumigena TaxID=70799 RepID=UPI00232EEF8F|nr:DNA methyltransferase [Nodularia spumigena]MDB9340008.1 ATP-binding protein [Nodularia spumigena CS-589/07]MDB9356371.1 ATP-binding protein [Nodularia spumigena CS-587/03]MDB9500525.1 ATP-binding protein [Nodularia spumigena CS-336/02]MDB9530935.1 ATP-binding protein [Nodularia spumigena CS-1038]